HWRIQHHDNRQRQADEEAVTHHFRVAFMHHAMSGVRVVVAVCMMRVGVVWLKRFARAIVRVGMPLCRFAVMLVFFSGVVVLMWSVFHGHVPLPAFTPAPVIITPLANS